MSDVERLGASCLALLGQARAILADVDAAVFTRTQPGVGSLGAQVRHCLDFYACLLDGLGTGRVDYDARDRDERLETRPELALARLDALEARLRAALAGAADRPLRVRVDEPEGAAGRAASSLGRELRFLVSHTVHHFAIVGLLLRAAGRPVDPAFGVAPSTLRQRGAAAGAGPGPRAWP
jgi:uncharacterized damage-inducible protein DinB